MKPTLLTLPDFQNRRGITRHHPMKTKILVLGLAALCCLTTAQADPTNGSSLRLDYVLNPVDFGIDPHEFGGALCLDGNRIAVHQWTGNGVVHVFEGSPATGFTNKWSIPSPDTTFNSATFGRSLGFRGDFLYAGSSHTWRAAPHDGTAYLLDLTTGGLKEKWTEAPHTAGAFGFTGGIAEDLLFVCQGSHSGWGSRWGLFVYLLSPTGDRTPVWSLIEPTVGVNHKPVIATRDHLFAHRPANAPEGAGIIVFDVLRDRLGNLTGIATNTALTDTNLWGDTDSGMMATSSDLLACGNPFLGDAGAVFLYRMTGTNGLTPLAAIPAPSGLSNAQFGLDVKFVAGKLAVGAPGFVAPDGKRGCIYLYDIAPDGTPILQHRYQPSVLTFGNEELFGAVMAAAGDRLVVSSSGQDGSGVRGVVYVLSVTNAPPPAPPEITAQPQNVTMVAGSATNFTVTATGTAPLAYQWRKDGLNLPGATNDTLNLANVQPVNIGDYSVVVSNPGGSVTSSNAALNLTGINFGEWAGLVAWYPLNGNAMDASPHHFDFLASPAFTADRFGSNASSAVFNAIAPISTRSLPFGPDGFSISLWLKLDRTPSTEGERILMHGDFNLPSSDPGAGLFSLAVWADGRCAISAHDSGNQGREVVASAGTIGTNRWYHIACYADGSALTLAINGVPIGSIATSLGTKSAPLVLGGDASYYFVSGLVDDVRIYNRAISPSDVRQLYTLDASPCIPHPATAIATVVNGSVTDIQLTDLGCGYTNAPIVRISGCGGTGATATTTIVNGYVTSITITSAGIGYTNAPRVRIASPPFMPSLSIAVSRVKVTQRVVLGRNYVLESSSDLQNWGLVGTRFTAEDELIEQEFEVGLTGRFFRIREVP